ncbi:MAG: Rieske 2Fe-2S domain-containing protein [Acidobacteria bacterium]|nr:Rieske 2Fe-2S domain-containing protein [Acidobacteriota bacterium]
MDQDPKNLQPSRRSFVDWLLGTAFGAVVVSAFYPVFRYVMPPKVVEAQTNRVLAGKVSEMKPNSGKIFRFGSKPGILIETPGGEIRAFTAICTHLQCTVQYRPDLEQIWCACHNGHYNLNGINVAGPPPRPLQPYKVAIQGDKIWVSRGA